MHPGMCFSMGQAGNMCLDLLFVFIDASKTVCKVKCLLFVEINDTERCTAQNYRTCKITGFARTFFVF